MGKVRAGEGRNVLFYLGIDVIFRAPLRNSLVSDSVMVKFSWKKFSSFPRSAWERISLYVCSRKRESQDNCRLIEDEV